jgi:hypothetical protein
MIQINPTASFGNGQATSEVSSRARVNQPKRSGGDAVRISKRKDVGGARSLTMDWAPSLRFKAQEKRGVQAMERLAKILPTDDRQRPRPELFPDPETKVRLTNAAERLLMEGLEGGAKVAFQDAMNALYEQYADDLDLDESDLAKARQSILRDAKNLLSDFSVKPWSPYDQEQNLSLDDLGKHLEEKVLRHRQMVMESSGDFSRVLSELTVRAKEGDEADLIRLGDFVIRFTEALDARTTTQMRADAKREMLGGPVQTIDDNALEMGKGFIEFLHNMRA